MIGFEAGAVAAAALLAGFVHGVSGFGSVLVALPLFSAAIGVRTAIPLACIMGFCINAMLLPGLRRHVNLRAVGMLAAFSVPGMLLGGWFLGRAPDGLLKFGIGLMLLYMAVRSVRPAAASRRGMPGLAAAAGLAAGFLGVSIGTNGPPILVWAARQPWTARMLKATIVGYFLVAGVGVVGVQAASGMVTERTLRLLAVLAPTLVLGVWAGGVCFGRITEAAFRRIFCVLLALMGAAMLWQSGLQLWAWLGG